MCWERVDERGLDLQSTRDVQVTRHACGDVKQADRRGSRSLGREVRHGSCCSGPGLHSSPTPAADREMDAFLALKTVKTRLSLRAVADVTAGI